MSGAEPPTSAPSSPPRSTTCRVKPRQSGGDAKETGGRMFAQGKPKVLGNVTGLILIK